MHRWVLVSVLLLSATISTASSAAGFAARVSPPRFELEAQPGGVLRETLEIGNADVDSATYVIRTADWQLRDDGGVVIHPPELQQDSCRPWTRIERRSLTLASEAFKRFRFEIHVPEDAPAGECRFALLIAPDPESEAALAEMANVRFPVTGQIAIVVYVAVGDARPVLEVREIRLQEVDGKPVPFAVFHNSGNAHGRPAGLLEGTDAAGQSLDFVVSPSPILPGRTVEVPLWPRSPVDTQQQVEFQPPVRIRGPIEWDGGNFEVDLTLD